MQSPLSVPQAAARLGVNASRVRALIATGELEATKVGGRWLVWDLSVAQRKRDGVRSGRPLEPHNAWALISIASDDDPGDIPANLRWRLQQQLALHGFAELAQRLRRRANATHFKAHPGELRHLAEAPELAYTGVSGAAFHGLDLVSGNELDAYICADALLQLISKHALADGDAGEANVTLRVVPPSAWTLAGRRVAPLAAVALDLAESSDARSARVGAAALRVLDKKLKKRR